MRFSTVVAAALLPVGLAFAQTNQTNSTGPQTWVVTVGAGGQKAYSPNTYVRFQN